jgi:hypothetical protein
MNIDITVIITALINFVAMIITVTTSNDKTKALINYKLEELTKHVEKHNQVVERMYNIEAVSERRDEQIKVINHRLEDIEEEMKD